MPFGSNPKVYKITLKSDEPFDPRGKWKARQIQVEQVEPPPWWSDYLMDEWKRKHLRQAHREARTQWQQAHDAWLASCRAHVFDLNNPGSTGAPRHQIWDQPAYYSAARSERTAAGKG